MDMYKKLVILLLVCISSVGFSQPHEIKIRFIANCALCISDGTSNVYFDFPYRSGFLMYAKYDRSEIKNLENNSVFIFTHKHPDHYSWWRTRKVKGKKYGPSNVEDLTELSASIQDFSIQAFKTKHRLSFHHYSYLVTWHNKRIFISGDTESADTIASLKNMDWLFAPAWVLSDAVEKNIKLNTKMIGIYHIGTKDQITTSQPEKILLFRESGQTVTMPW